MTVSVGLISVCLSVCLFLWGAPLLKMIEISFDSHHECNICKMSCLGMVSIGIETILKANFEHIHSFVRNIGRCDHSKCTGSVFNTISRNKSNQSLAEKNQNRTRVERITWKGPFSCDCWRSWWTMVSRNRSFLAMSGTLQGSGCTPHPSGERRGGVVPEVMQFAGVQWPKQWQSRCWRGGENQVLRASCLRCRRCWETRGVRCDVCARCWDALADFLGSSVRVDFF